MLTSVGVTLNDDSSRRVADIKVEDLALIDQDVERLHQLRNASSQVSGVNVILHLISLILSSEWSLFEGWQIRIKSM